MKKCAVYIEEIGSNVYINNKDGNSIYKPFDDAWKAREFAENMGHKIAYNAKDAAESDEKDAVMARPFGEDTMCVFVGGEFDGLRMSVRQVRWHGKVRGKMSDMSEYRKNGGMCYAPIFDNAPEVEGYVGPMWGGLGTPFRYETSEVYAQMSI